MTVGRNTFPTHPFRQDTDAAWIHATTRTAMLARDLQAHTSRLAQAYTDARKKDVVSEAREAARIAEEMASLFNTLAETFEKARYMV